MKISNLNPRQLERVETEHKIYKIVAADMRGRSEAFAFAGRRKIDELAASSVAGAVDEMRARLDARLAAFTKRRVDGIPSAEEFADALNVAFANGQARLEKSLSAHRRFRNATATLAETASRSDLSEEQVERDYLRFGRWLSAQLQAVPTEPSNAPEKRQPMAVFASFDMDRRGAPVRLVLRPELVAALNECQSA